METLYSTASNAGDPQLTHEGIFCLPTEREYFARH